MNVMIVTPERISAPNHLAAGGTDVWFRSAEAGLMSLAVDVLILAPGCTPRQRSLAMGKVVPGGRAFDLVPVGREQ